MLEEPSSKFLATQLHSHLLDVDSASLSTPLSHFSQKMQDPNCEGFVTSPPSRSVVPRGQEHRLFLGFSRPAQP